MNQPSSTTAMTTSAANMNNGGNAAMMTPAAMPIGSSSSSNSSSNNNGISGPMAMVGNAMAAGNMSINDINTLLATALQNPQLASSPQVQALLQTINAMASQNGIVLQAQPQHHPVVVNVMANTNGSNNGILLQQQQQPAAIINNNTMANNTACNNGTNGGLHQQQPQQQAVQQAVQQAPQQSSFNLNPGSSSPNNVTPLIQDMAMAAPASGSDGNINMLMLQQQHQHQPQLQQQLQQQQQQQQPVQQPSSGFTVNNQTVQGQGLNFNSNNVNIVPSANMAIQQQSSQQLSQPVMNAFQNNNGVVSDSSKSSNRGGSYNGGHQGSSPVHRSPQPVPQQQRPIVTNATFRNNAVVSDSSNQGFGQQGSSPVDDDAIGNDFEPSDFRRDAECFDILMNNSFMNDDIGNIGNNNGSACQVVASNHQVVQVAGNSNGNQQQQQQQQQQQIVSNNNGAHLIANCNAPGPAPQMAVISNINKNQPQQPSQQLMPAVNTGNTTQQQPSQQPPQQQQQLNPHQQQMQEHLRQVSQQQMQQFQQQQLRQQQMRQQQQLKLQFLQQQQQQQQQQNQQVQQHQQQVQQSSVQLMQSDLQALQVLHAQQKSNQNACPNNNTSSSCNSPASTDAQGQDQANTVPNLAPLKPNNENIQGQRVTKRTARSTKRTSHNPRADNSSNWDENAPNHAAKDKNNIGSSDMKPSNFHYIKVVGGGIKRPAPTAGGGASPPPSSPACPVTSRPTNVTIVPAVPSASPKIAALRPPPASPSNKRMRSASTSSSSTPSTLQDYLDSILTSRGYSPEKRPASQLGYRQPPTPLQLASFGFAVCSTIKPGGADRLVALLGAGLSPNPTNKFGDSPFFMACKRGFYESVKAFVDNGAEVRVADGFGRTPLHYVAWANPPCLRSARLLLEANGKNDTARLLYVMDAHGKTPLDFVGEQHRSRWVEFLETVKEEFWPKISKKGSSSSGGSVGYFPEARDENGSGIPDPQEALQVRLAEKVASGHIMPEEAKRQQQQKNLLQQRQQ